MNQRIYLILTGVMILSACQGKPSEGAIQTAIAETQAAQTNDFPTRSSGC